MFLVSFLHLLFPLVSDVVLVCGYQIMGLKRGVEVGCRGCHYRTALILFHLIFSLVLKEPGKATFIMLLFCD